MNNETFIRIYKIEKKICDLLIDYHKKNNEYKNNGEVIVNEKTIKDINIKDSTDVVFFNSSQNETIKMFFYALSKCLNEYCNYYKINQQFITCNENVIQHYPIGGGYKVWHYENAGIKFSKRKLVYMLYLNNVKNGGTEWLYQNLKTEAVKGNLVIWPSAFTHTHRGVISNNKEKYIATGWFENI